MEFIGIDIGSQGTKLTLINQKGEIITEDYLSYPIEYPQPFWAEQNPEVWEHAIVKGLKNITAQSKNPNEIIAIGIDAQVDGIVPIDRNGNALYHAIIWMDRRATAEEALIADVIGEEEIFSTTGCNLDASHILPKVLWLQKNVEDFDKAYKLLMPASYVLFFLTGEFGVDYSNASSTLFFDIRERTWHEDILKQFKIHVSLLPEIFPSTYNIGHLKGEIAASVGFGTHRPIVAVGAGDEHAACVGAGVIEEGIAFDIAGTAEVVGVSSASPLLDPGHLVETHGHASPDHWLLENPGFVSGGNFRWFRDNLCTIGKHQLSYTDLTKEAENIPPGSEGLIFLPTLMGAMTPEWNSYAKGNIYGLSMNCTRAHITRAILEASAYGIRDIVEAFKNMGLTFSKIRVTGGGSKSTFWNRIKADVLNLSVETLFTSETTSFGSALIGAVSGGVFPTLQAASASTVKIKEVIEPQTHRTVYDEMHQQYRDLYFSLQPLFNRQGN